MYDNDYEGVWHFQMDLPALVDDLRRASAEVQRADCDGNINADIPAMVLTDLGALTLEHGKVTRPRWAGGGCSPRCAGRRATCSTGSRTTQTMWN